jgi:hypothetical protein
MPPGSATASSHSSSSRPAPFSLVHHGSKGSALPGTSTITATVGARIPYADVDTLHRVAIRDGHTVSSLVATLVHDGLRRHELSLVSQQGSVSAK